MRIHVAQNDWSGLKKPKASKQRGIASLMGGRRSKFTLEDIWLDTKLDPGIPSTIKTMGGKI